MLAGDDLLPPGPFDAQTLHAGIGQPVCPVAEGGGFGRELDCGTLADLCIGGFEVFEQDAPGNAIDGQMVDDEQEASGLLVAKGEVAGQRTRGPCCRFRLACARLASSVRRAARCSGERADRSKTSSRDVVYGRCVFLQPDAIHLGEAQAQGVMMVQKGIERGLQMEWVERWCGFEQHRLVEMMGLAPVQVQEPPLDGRERQRTADFSLSGRGLSDACGNGCQLANGLMLEDLAWGEAADRPGVRVRRPGC